MSVIIVSILCLVNIFLWFLFFRKFTKLFSTDDIILNTRVELGKLITDINRNAERNITLVESRINDLKAIIAEADNRILLVREQQKKQNLKSAYSNRIDSILRDKNQVTKRVSDAYKKNAVSDTSYSNLFNNSVFDVNNSSENLISNTEATLPIYETTVDQDGNSYKDIPLLRTNVSISDNPIVIKKSFNDEVKERYEKGYTIEEIATSLSRSVTEVQFVLDLNE